MKATELRLINVSDFTKDKAALKQLAEENFVKNPTINKDMGSMNQKRWCMNCIMRYSQALNLWAFS